MYKNGQQYICFIDFYYKNSLFNDSKTQATISKTLQESFSPWIYDVNAINRESIEISAKSNCEFRKSAKDFSSENNEEIPLQVFSLSVTHPEYNTKNPNFQIKIQIFASRYHILLQGITTTAVGCTRNTF